ncbi:hypothetical protein QQ045_009410 [Rhodiola kirilowii]
MCGDVEKSSEEVEDERLRQNKFEEALEIQSLRAFTFVEEVLFSSTFSNSTSSAKKSQDEFWVQRRDATGLLGLLPEQKMTGAIRMLTYGACADQCAEITRMDVTATLECMKKWCTQVVDIYKDRYLRSLNATDLSRLL